MSNKAIIYCRKSNDIGQDVEHQIRSCEAYCNANGLEVIDIIKDEGISAYRKDYPLDMIEVITESINSLKMAIEALEIELDSLRNNIADEQKVAQKQIQISEQLLDFKFLYNKATVQEKKILIRNIVEKIIIEDYDKVEIVYKY